jgi:P4 family phage/plasmid primase-like protien
MIGAVEAEGCQIGISLGKAGLPLNCNSKTGYLWCLDFDGFAELDGTGVDDGVNDTVKALSTYCEISPSTTGFKAYVVSDAPPETEFSIDCGPSEFADRFPEIEKYQNRQIEVFSRKRFLALTGNLYNASMTSLQYIPAKDLNGIFDKLHGWAQLEGGEGLQRRAGNNTALHDTDSLPITYSRLKPKSLERVLKFHKHQNEVCWSNAANALARAYGAEGAGYFEEFSKGHYAGRPYKKYDQKDVEDRYHRALSELADQPDGLGCRYLVETARQHEDWPTDTKLEWEDPLESLHVDGDIAPVAPNNPLFASNDSLVSLLNYGNSTWPTPPSPTDTGLADIANGRRFADEYRGELVYVDDTDTWLQFSADTGWIRAKPKAAEAAAKQIAKALVNDAAEAFKTSPDSKTTKNLLTEATRTNKAPQIKAMLQMAISEPGMAKRSCEFDADNWLLGVRNGVLDLRTGKLMLVNPNLLVSKRANVKFDPNADCPRFKKFLREVVPDDDCRAFLLKWFGYVLTGDVSEQKLLFLSGEGRNGKSTLVEVQAHLMGDYAGKISTETLMRTNRNPQAASPDIMSFQGKRLVHCNETAEGRVLDDARVKELTGGDTLVGRGLYGRVNVEFTPTHKLLMAGNHQPSVKDNSEGMWRRIIFFPFNQKIPESKKDKGLLPKLIAEGPGILNLMLKGLAEWRRRGLDIPNTLQNATNAYRDEQDLVAEWLNEQCEVHNTHMAKKTELYSAYKNWCSSSGCYPMARQRFSRQLSKKGYKTASDNRTVQGLRLNQEGRYSELGV